MSIRILVADDDPDIVFSLSERLRWLGHDVITAGDGKAALAAVESHATRMSSIQSATELPGNAPDLSR